MSLPGPRSTYMCYFGLLWFYQPRGCMITIDAEGGISPDNESIKKFLKRHAGRYRVMSTVPRLLVLQRLEQDGKGVPRTLMNGSIERPGWLIEIINFITNSRLSGDLVTVSKGVQRELIFEKGAMRVAFSTARSDLLGEFILREGILSKEQLVRSSSRPPTSGLARCWWTWGC